MTVTFLGAVGSMEALQTGQGADGAHPARWAAAGAMVGLEDTSIVARRSAGAEGASSVLETGHLTAGPSSVWGAEAGSSLGVTGCPMAVAAELAGRAIAARGAGLKAVWGLQARRAGTCPTLGVTGAVVATAAGLVTLWPPHSWGARTGAVVTSPGLHTLALIGRHAAAMDTVLGAKCWGGEGVRRHLHLHPDPPSSSEPIFLPPTPGTWRSPPATLPLTCRKTEQRLRPELDQTPGPAPQPLSVTFS